MTHQQCDRHTPHDTTDTEALLEQELINYLYYIQIFRFLNCQYHILVILTHYHTHSLRDPSTNSWPFNSKDYLWVLSLINGLQWTVTPLMSHPGCEVKCHGVAKVSIANKGIQLKEVKCRVVCTWLIKCQDPDDIRYQSKVWTYFSFNVSFYIATMKTSNRWNNICGFM